MPASMAMIAITTSNSISVNAHAARATREKLSVVFMGRSGRLEVGSFVIDMGTVVVLEVDGRPSTKNACRSRRRYAGTRLALLSKHACFAECAILGPSKLRLLQRAGFFRHAS